MDMKTLIETCAEISYNHALRSVEICWKGFADADQYKKVLEHSLASIKETKSTIWISDMVNGKAVPHDAIAWIQKDFIPRAVQYGVKKMAFLVTGNAFGKLHAANLKHATKQYHIEMDHFDSRPDLDEWLFS
jgi:hypothetical protein